MTDFAALREAMVKRQIEARGIRDPGILDAFRAVPRERFVADEFAQYAYTDGPLPIEAQQTISQPYIVALMIEAVDLKAGDKVLEVGAGSGYAAAVIAQIADEVVGIERVPILADRARALLRALGYGNIEIVQADGTKGWPDKAPYDVIMAAASGSHVPQTLLDQLAPGGRLVMPVGNPGSVQTLVKVVKDDAGKLRQSDLGGVRFVPLIGEEGWTDDYR